MTLGEAISELQQLLKELPGDTPLVILEYSGTEWDIYGFETRYDDAGKPSIYINR